MNAMNAIRAYEKVRVESSVTAADSHELISLLFQGALLAISHAKVGIEHKDITAKGAAITRAIAIIGDGLHASLDKKAGGELAQNLASLYDYMVARLLTANLDNDVAVLEEVENLLSGLKEAWDGIRPQVTQNSSKPSSAAV
jgi:flagellar protein FliS